MVQRSIPRRSLTVFFFGITVLFAWTGWCVHNVLHSPAQVDNVFSSYWSSGDAANHHLNPYTPQPTTLVVYVKGEEAHPIVDLNLNPPLLLPLFQAIAKLPINGAFILWTIVSALLFAATAATILWLTPTMSEASILCLTLGMPIIVCIGIGQLYALLFVLGALAWFAIKRNNQIVAALAMGLLIAIRPIFVVWPVFLFLADARKLALRAAVVAALASAAPLALYGYTIVPRYLAALHGDMHYLNPDDISLPAVAARLGIPTVGAVASVLLLAALLLYVWRTRPDASITTGIAVSAALLCSPLAWVHYTLVLFPALATEPEHRLKSPIVVLLSVPMFFPAMLMGAHDLRTLVANLIFFAPCALFLAWFLAVASSRAKLQATADASHPADLLSSSLAETRQ